MKKQSILRTFFLLVLVGTGSVAIAQIRPGGINLPRGIPTQGGQSGGGIGGSQGGSQGGGAILDDSTQNLYGPSTALHFYEDDILNNRDSLRYRLDTSLTGVHRWNFVDRSWNHLVDLGNLGTATRQTFFQPRTQVGAQLGFRAYDPYAIQQDEVRYYDTKSPLTEMTFFSGGRGRNILRFGFNQNINSKLNLGFRLQRFTSNKQYGTFSTLGSEANLAQNWNFLFHGSYTSPNKKYSILGHYRHLNHDVKEQGGLLNVQDTVDTGQKLFIYDGQARLSDLARSWERRHVYHVYQQYRLANGFQLFQQGGISFVKDRYVDNNPAQGFQNRVYPDTLFGSDSTRQDIYYRLIDTKLGIKGTFSGFNYRAWYRPRIYSINSIYNNSDTTRTTYSNARFENIVGLWLSYYLKDSSQHITAEGEHLLGRDFMLRGELSTRWFRAGYQTSFWTPDLLMQRYISNHLRWDNDFKLTGANTIFGALPVKVKDLSFVPEMQYHLVSRYVYYDTAAVARQFNGSFSLLRIGARISWQKKKFNASGQGFYTVNSNSDVIRIPALFVSAELSYDLIYAKVLYIQLGLAAHYRSSYLADAYMPLTQQFFLQNDFVVDRYLIADAFASLRINRVRLLLKMSHINEGFGVAGYYTTPRYLGLQRTFSFGLYWPLFD
ncbi:putative porin [Arundinibacter roseus]|uniref:Porin n=1 Tax=Arundinibacter roseus TaxID=2070510 RepID=A0A4R4KDT7_9BACT|nr:putative porin [Arundinibacter roseus]TDB64559.1 hypothetical protein EZE20_12860 [Arundinibacter roseus]